MENKALIQYLIKKIQRSQNAINFATFMQDVLYHPQWGYYMRPDIQIGAGGDFTTAPEISPVFAMCLAEQCKEVITECSQPIIVEYGAGSGQMAFDILSSLQKKKALPKAYYIVEISPSLQVIQKEKLKHIDVCPIFWVQNPPDCFEGIVLGNEFLDSLPVHQLIWEANHFYSVEIIEQKNQLTTSTHTQIFSPESNALLDQLLEYSNNFSSGHLIEINTVMEQWLENIEKKITKGILLLIDYGMTAHEYFHAERKTGSLVCHYKHTRNHDPLINIGFQDITNAVNFSFLYQKAKQLKMDILGYNTQVHFLLNTGLDEAITIAGENGDPVKLAAAIRLLTLPSEMGELCKVIGLGKRVKKELIGFRAFNQVARL